MTEWDPNANCVPMTCKSNVHMGESQQGECEYSGSDAPYDKCYGGWASSCSSGGAGGGSNPDPDDPNTGGSIPGGGTTVGVTPLEDKYTQKERVLNCINGVSFGESVSIDEDFFNSIIFGRGELSQIENYLDDNACSEEAQNFAKLALEAIDKGGEFDYPNKVILGSSFVNNVKLKCAYDKLTSDNNPLFRTTVGAFIDDPKFNLTFKVGNCPTTNDQCTNSIDPYNITITFEDVGLDPVEMASAILHEAIHAEMARFIEQFTTGEDVNDRPRIFQLYKYYKDLYTTGNINHIYMTETYITPISLALRQFDDNSYPSNHYKSFAWDGLRDWDANNYLGMDPLSGSYGTYRNLVIENSTICD